VRHCILTLVLAALVPNFAYGQAIYNPYAKSEENLSPIKDGKLNWPSFFKSKKLEDRFQAYFAMGSCVGTKQTINNMLRDNTVDVNMLPEATVRGTSVGCDVAAITIAAPTGQRAVVLAHPAGVTKVSVAGAMTARELKPEMVVRFLGRVDKRGMGTEAIEAIEVITPGPDFVWLPVEAEQMQPITGKVTLLKGQRLTVRVEAGKMRRLNFHVSDQAKVKVDGSSLFLASAGDEVSTTGHLYSGVGAAGQQVVLASEITVTNSLSVSRGEKPTTTTPPVESIDASGAGTAN
jgi:hypothetical protein